jgi:hypothetical protein
MELVLFSASMTGVFMLANARVGGMLERYGQPYGRVRLIVHGLLCFTIVAGYGVTVDLFQSVPYRKVFAMTAFIVTGATLLVNVGTGFFLLSGRTRNKVLIMVHRIASLIMLFSIVFGIGFLRLKL